MSLDFRTRCDDEVGTIDAREFFEVQLPTLARERSQLAVPGARELEISPLTVAMGDASWTLSLGERMVEVVRGDVGGAIVRLSSNELRDIVFDLRTPMTLMTAGTLDMPRGKFGTFLDWWVVLRSLLDGRRVHTRGSVDFRDRDGGPLDLRRAFEPDEDVAEASHFLAETGYLHLRRVFTEDEMAQVSHDMDEALPSYQPDDGRSWWARTAEGSHRAVRLQYFQEHSPMTSSLLKDDRLQRLARLSDDGYQLRAQGNMIEALVKPIGVVEGISDVPWHKDCSLGRHSYRCCSLTVGISVTGADARSGQLATVAGSHRALVQPAFSREEWGLPEITLPTETGDVTVHCSCTLHMSHPPQASERRVMYTDFVLPPRPGDGAAHVSQSEIARVREQAYKTVSQAPGHLG